MQNEVMSRQRASINTTTSPDEWRSRYETLEKDYEEQKRVTEHVRQEAFQSLQEMIALSKRTNQAAELEESLLKQIAELETSVTHWKDRYHKSQQQQSAGSAARLSASNPLIPPTQTSHHTNSYTSYAGLVQSTSLQHFNASIDELLHLSRSADPAETLEHMRRIVSCVRAITEDIDMATASLPTAEAAALRQPNLRAKVTAAANGLITAAKTFSSGKGLAPVSLLDASAGSLVGTVVELVQIVKVRPEVGQVVQGQVELGRNVGLGQVQSQAQAHGHGGQADMGLSEEPPNDDGEVDFS